MGTVLIDIETLPAVDWNAEQRHAFVVGKVPKTHKKVDSILEWMRENGEEEFRRTALDFRHGWIACVSIGTEQGKIKTFLGVPHGCTDRATCLKEEARMFDEIAEVLGTKTENKAITWLGWNNSGFDMPWLHKASLRAGQPGLARKIAPPWATKYKLPWTDLMEVYCCFQYGNRAKQKHAAEYLGISEPSPDIDGSMVYDQWLAGNLEYVRHCESDIETLRQIALKLGVLTVF